MQLFELEKGDYFTAHFSFGDDLDFNITGTFIKCDGMYGHVLLDNKTEIEKYLCGMEVKIIKKGIDG